MTRKRQLILLRLWTTFALLGESAMLSVLLGFNASSGVALLFLSPLFLLFILMVLLLAYLVLPFLYSACRDGYGYCRHWQWFF